MAWRKGDNKQNQTGGGANETENLNETGSVFNYERGVIQRRPSFFMQNG